MQPLSNVSELSETFDSGLLQLSASIPFELDTSVREQMLQFVFLLQKWNRVYNLTAVRETRAMVQRHLLDSLVLCAWLPPESGLSDANTDVIDVGSGAGLPVLPLALARPDLHFISIESNGKKTRFQQQVLVELGIKNVKVLNKRVQDVAAQDKLRATIITSRAFSAPHDFLRIASPLCASDAQAIIMLGQVERLEMPLPQPFHLEELVPVDIPGNSAARHVAVCRCKEV